MRWLSLGLLVCVAACGRAPDRRGMKPDEVLVQVSATGRTDTRPDEARFTAGVQSTAASAGAASTANNAAMAGVMRAVEASGVKADDVQTRSITLSRIGYGPERGRYRADNLVEIRVRDLARASQAIAAATQAGANVVSGPNLGIADPEAASRSAYAAAYRAARARAETYAAAAGLKIVRVLAIRDGGAQAGGTPYDGNMSMQVQAAPTVSAPPPLRPGMTASEVRVNADFVLAPR